MTTPFRLQLVREGSTSLDVYPSDSDDQSYSFRYAPPAGSSIRSSVRSRIDRATFDRITAQIDETFSGIAGRGRRAGGLASLDADVKQLEAAGRWLWKALPPDIRRDLAEGEHVLELGLADNLLDCPWELLHDEGDFICLKHSIARHINLDAGPGASRASTWVTADAMGKVSVLLVSVPQPDVLGLVRLPEVDRETEEIKRCLGDKAQIDLKILEGDRATIDEVVRAAARGYHIVHFSGHGVVDEASNHSLALQDGLLSARNLAALFDTKPPLLFFLNACHTSGTDDIAVGDVARRWLRGDSFAQTVLENGSYLLGSRWPLSDVGAAVFASAFYNAFLRQLIGPSAKGPQELAVVSRNRNATLGEAILYARQQCASSEEGEGRRDLAWGSYVFYGEPQLAFVMTPWGRRAERDRIMISLVERIIEGEGAP